MPLTTGEGAARRSAASVTASGLSSRSPGGVRRSAVARESVGGTMELLGSGGADVVVQLWCASLQELRERADGVGVEL